MNDDKTLDNKIEPQQAGSKPASNEDEKQAPSLEQIIRTEAREEEAPQSRNFTLMKILGGNILTAAAVRRQVGLIIVVAVFLIIYISFRYSCQQDMIKIDRLQDDLQDAKYKALSSNSQITERSRESNVLNLLKNNKDSVLKIPTQPPYIINVPEEK